MGKTLVSTSQVGSFVIRKNWKSVTLEFGLHKTFLNFRLGAKWPDFLPLLVTRVKALTFICTAILKSSVRDRNIIAEINLFYITDRNVSFDFRHAICRLCSIGLRWSQAILERKVNISYLQGTSFTTHPSFPFLLCMRWDLTCTRAHRFEWRRKREK